MATRPSTAISPISPFAIEDYIPASATTCPTPNQFASNGILIGQGLPGGCTRDIVHRFYSEQYQLNNGQQNRYMTGSDASGLTMGYFHTQNLPIYKYLHGANAPHYVVADNLYQGAFGGSFLNHQVLVAGTAPIFANADQSGGSTDLHSILDTNNMATSTPLYTPTGSVKDQQLTQKCGASNTLACGDYAVNTIQPTYQPFSPRNRVLQAASTAHQYDNWRHHVREMASSGLGTRGAGQTRMAISASLAGPNGTKKEHSCKDPNVNPAAVWPNCPDGAFQFHHQAFNFYASFQPGSEARKDHLKDEASFFAQAQNGTLPSVALSSRWVRTTNTQATPARAMAAAILSIF
ncbi:MAG: alkaline phosphatase family protein [Rhizomicrobium sp.]